MLLLAVDESRVSPGAIGGLVILALGIATYLLLRNFVKRLRRLRSDD